jgi:7-cyano-7-deazaguanine synthase
MNGDSGEAVLLASGGLDSTTLAFWLRERGVRFRALFVDYGQHCARTELEALRRLLPPECGGVHTVCISDVYRQSTSRLIREPDLWVDNMAGDPLYLPYRNLLLLSVGAAFAQSCGCSRLYAAFINSNHAKEIDCSAGFFTELNRLLAEYGSVEVVMPFRDMPKAEVARIAAALGVPLGPVRK